MNKLKPLDKKFKSLKKKLKPLKKHILKIVIGLVILLTGFSFAYYNITFFGNETNTTITGDAGTMVIKYSGGATINTDIVFPDDAPFATKNFTVTGNIDTD